MGLAEAIRKAYQQGKELAEIVGTLPAAPGEKPQLDSESLVALLDIARQGPAAMEPVVRRAAIPRWFDRQDFELFTDKHADVAFGVFTRRADVTPAQRPGTFCLRDLPRKEALSRWNKTERKRFAARLVRHYEKRGDGINAFVCRLYADPVRASAEFLRRYREADRPFDYAALDDLLGILRDRQLDLPASLVKTLSDREQYYQSRVLHADDWTRSQDHLERPNLLREFRTFFQSPKQFLMHLHAPGGAGKTAFLQWLVSRYLIVERPGSARVPTAKMDMDQVDLAAIRQWPWLLLIPIARQLNRQLTETKLENLLHRFLPAEPVVRRPRRLGAIDQQRGELYKVVESVAATAAETAFEDFAKAIGTSRCLVILDTVEELMLHQPVQFRQVLSGLDKVRRACPGFRLLISGRYPLDEMKEFTAVAEELGTRMTSVEVPRFLDKEGEEYLSRIRGIGNLRLVRRIVQHSSGSPLMLSLFADLAESSGGLSKEDLRHPGIARLLHRIIERIPKDELALRWALRYAVVPRDELEPEFFDAVIKPHLERAIAKQTGQRDDPTKSLPAGFGNPWKYIEGGKVQRAELWEALRKYAGPLSWVTFDGEVVHLKPEVVQPMRWLLRQQEVFQDLHSSAIAYFDNLAATRPSEEWARWTAEAIYHRFQCNGAAAAKYWLDLVDRTKAADISARRTLAEIVTGKDFLDDRDKPLQDPATGQPIIDDATLARARLELGSFHAQEAFTATSGSVRDGALEDAVRELRLLKQVEQRMGAKLPDQGRRAYVEASVASYLGQYDRMRRIVNASLAAQPESPYNAPLLLLSARAEGTSAAEATELYSRAASASLHSNSLLRLLDIRQEQARFCIDAGDLERADAFLDEVVAEAREKHDLRALPVAVASQLEIARLLGSTQRAEEILKENRSMEGTAAGIAANAFVALSRGQAEDWLSENSGRKSAWSEEDEVEQIVWRASALAELFRTAEAYELLETAGSRLRSGRADLAERLALEKAQIAIDAVGDRVAARSILYGGAVSKTNELRYRLLSMRVESVKRRGSVWLEDLRPIYSKLSVREKAHALVHWIACSSPGDLQWAHFEAVFRQIKPAEARFTVLRPLVDAPTQLGGNDLSFADLFPDPDPGPDFLERTLLLTTLYTAMGGRVRAQELLTRARKGLPLANLILLNRFIRTARRCRLAHDPELLRAANKQIAANREAQPGLAAVSALEIAYWHYVLHEYDEATTMNRTALSIAGEAHYRFEGRYVGMRARLSRFRDEAAGVEENSTRVGVPFNAPDVLQLRVKAPDVVGTTLERPELLSIEGELPFPDSRLSKGGWELSYEWLAKISRDKLLPLAGGRPLTANLELRVNEGSLGNIPWEVAFQHVTSGYMYRSEGARTYVIVRWFQRTLSLLGYSTLVNGEWSESDNETLLKAASELKIRGDLSSAEAKMALRKATKVQPTLVLVKDRFENERERKRSYGAAGIDVVRNVADIVAGDDLIDFRSNRAPALLWISGFLESVSSGLVLVVEEGVALTAHELSRALGSGDGPFPGVFLDIPDGPDRAHQCAWRNRFAGDLYRQGAVRSVLAAGFVPGQKLGAYVSELRDWMKQMLCEGEMAKRLMPYGFYPPVLYCADPTIPIL